MSENANDLIVTDGKVDAGQHRNATIAGVDVIDLEHQAAFLPRYTSRTAWLLKT